MKTIGLIGGMTPESTLMYYTRIIELGRERWSDPLHNPVMVIVSIDLAEIAAHQNVGDADRVVEILTDALGRLHRAGAEIGAMTANTPHLYFDRLAAAAPLPLVHIVDAALERARSLKVNKALLLGTRATMEGSLYPKPFTAAGIEILTPDRGERELINRSIYEDLARGVVTPELREAYLELCRRRIEGEDVDAVILGCTEIPLVIKPGDLPVPLIDTARCHAETIFTAALDG